MNNTEYYNILGIKTDASEEEIIEPANIDPGRAIAAAMNMEFIPTSDMKKKYDELGKAMASIMAKEQQ